MGVSDLGSCRARLAVTQGLWSWAQEVVGGARTEGFEGCGMKGDCPEQWGRMEGEGRMEREKKACVLKGWERKQRRELYLHGES